MLSEPSASGVAWAPDSSRLAFVEDDLSGLRTIEPGSLASTLVSSLAPGETLLIDQVEWAPDASRLAYLSEDLHVSFPTTDYGAERITPLLHGTGRSTSEFQWTGDSSRLVFRADIAAAKAIELFVAPRDGSDLLVLSPPLVFGGQVLDFELR